MFVEFPLPLKTKENSKKDGMIREKENKEWETRI